MRRTRLPGDAVGRVLAPKHKGKYTITFKAVGGNTRTLLKAPRAGLVRPCAPCSRSSRRWCWLRSAPRARAGHGLTLGFSSDPALTTGSASSRAVWIDRAVAAGAGIVRVNVDWAQVAPTTRPSGFAADDPASPGYDWSSLDSTVSELSAHGLKVMLTIYDAPAWAEGADPPPGTTPGTWRPSPSQLAAFATAAATRYDGHYPDPASPGASLPRVSYWQAWDEPNLDYYLSPQWTQSGNTFVPASPAIYKAMENAFYAAVKVKGVSPSNYVIIGGTAPFGDPPGGQRMQPVACYRTLFCLQGSVALKPISRPDPVHLDGLDHHPYSVGGPLWHALNADDVSVPDMYKIARVLRAAERAHHVLPKIAVGDRDPLGRRPL